MIHSASSVQGIHEFLKEEKDCVLIWDKKVHELYGQNLSHSHPEFISQEGENCKTFAEYQRCSEALLDFGLHRQSQIIAIGGGAVGDLAGFVAATLLRGLSWSLVPTTLLSMIDSSIGGKTAINSMQGKNLVGAFHRPQNIFLCLDFLQTLPDEQTQSGMGELIKTYFLSETLRKLMDFDSPFAAVVEESIHFKNKITQEDFKEEGLRKILNLGHTFGHLYETQHNLPHGLAVLYGLKREFKEFSGPSQKLEELLAKYKISLDDTIYQSLNLEDLKFDKKRTSEKTISLKTVDQDYKVCDVHIALG
jgi:3-dehydroquinate synthetase